MSTCMHTYIQMHSQAEALFPCPLQCRKILLNYAKPCRKWSLHILRTGVEIHIYDNIDMGIWELVALYESNIIFDRKTDR